MKDNEKQNNNSGRLGRSERDGITQRRIAWPERVIMALAMDGTGSGRWMTHKAVRQSLIDQGHSNPPERLTLILRNLVKSGHVERAIKPEHIGGVRGNQEYIYRRTAKAFKPVNMGQGLRNGTKAADIQRGFQLRLDHPRLPKWFRDMMQ